MKPGRAILAGAGPGDINLITARALDALRRADAIVYDRLINLELLQLASPAAEFFDVGKTPGAPGGPSQEEICRLLVEQARGGRTVVRLKGGDPFVFGRGGEEALALAEAGIPFEVIPGITAGIAAPAYAGIPVTHRGLASSVTFVTGRTDPRSAVSSPLPPGEGRERGHAEESRAADAGINWKALASTGGTLVFYMGVAELPNITRSLLDAGLAPDTPAVIIERGTTPRQRSIRSTLGNIAKAAQDANVSPPAITVIGKVAGMPAELNWFESLPLFGRRIVITRAAEQADVSADLLASLGAEPIIFPTIETLPVVDTAPLDEAIASLADYSWIVFTSANAVMHFMERLFEKGHDARALAGMRVACMGPVTAETLSGYGIRADFVPEKSTSTALAKELADIGDLSGKRILLPQSDLAREDLRRLLRDVGAKPVPVTTYLTRTTAAPDARALDVIRSGDCDVVTFTSPSTIHAFVQIVGTDLIRYLDGRDDPVIWSAIGPVTGAEARRLGLKNVLEATDHTFAGLVDLLCRHFGNPPDTE